MISRDKTTTARDKTTTANVVRSNTNKASKDEVLSEGVQSSTANDSSDIRILIKTSSGVCIAAVGLNLEGAVLFSDTLHLSQIIESNNINGLCLAH